MKFTKILLTTAFFSFSLLNIGDVYAHQTDNDKQIEQVISAYKNGDYLRAFNLLQPLVEQNDPVAQGIRYDV